MTFLNGPGDNIQSDGKPYVGGVDGVAADGTMADAELNWVVPSEMAQLRGTYFKGNYRMPHGMTVYCPTCPAPAPCPGWATWTPCANPKN